MISFYQYLVESGHLSPDTLLEAVDERLKIAPCLARIAFESSAISEAELNELLDQQNATTTSFHELLNQHLTEADPRWAAIQTKAARSSPSLASLLLEKGAVSVSEIVSALDEYLAKAMKEKQEIKNAEGS